MNDEYKEMYEDLLIDYRKIVSKLDKLQSQLSRSNLRINELNGRISQELEPRIENEKKQYDRYALSGASDICMLNGINGNCGVNCPGYKEKCHEEWKDE